eukprot:scaffold1851_cov172-Alexandrium_tamarense.AAC.7
MSMYSRGAVQREACAMKWRRSGLTSLSFSIRCRVAVQRRLEASLVMYVRSAVAERRAEISCPANFVKAMETTGHACNSMSLASQTKSSRVDIAKSPYAPDAPN